MFCTCLVTGLWVILIVHLLLHHHNAFPEYWNSVRFRLLDIIPIAREKVIEAMNEGLIVTDNQDRIVDLNQEIRRILSIDEKKIIGKRLGLILLIRMSFMN